jgi:hypothetical protein
MCIFCRGAQGTRMQSRSTRTWWPRSAAIRRPVPPARGTRRISPGRTLGRDAAAAQDHQLVHPFLDLRQDVRSDDDGRALRAQLVQDAVEIVDAVGIEAVGRLVKEDQLRRAEQQLGKAQALPHAFRVAAHTAVGRGGKTDPFQHVAAGFARHLLQVGEQLQQLHAGQVVVGDKILRQVADTAPHIAERAVLRGDAAQPHFA